MRLVFEFGYVLIGIVIVLWAITIPILNNVFLTLGDRGTFGDMFGSVNALFSGLALAGIIYTIFLQKTELSLQRNELKMTRGELERSTKAQLKSERALTKQADSLKLTAKLNGLGSLLNYHSLMTQQGANFTMTEGARKEIGTIKGQIEDIIRNK